MIRLLLLITLIPISLFASLKELEQKVLKDMEMLNYPTASWRQEDDAVCDVAIIGGGMAGTALAFQLKLEGVYNVQIFDENPKGEEGPWLTTARMMTLRSGKGLRGPALGIPHLTFRAWYEAQMGAEAWHELDKIPTPMWGHYLQWMRKVLEVEVQNNMRVQDILIHADKSLTLIFEDGKTVHARKVVLATGRAGFGGFQIPAFVAGIPKSFWAHTGERMAADAVAGKSVTVIGVGASGFDAAAFALENGADDVKMLMRRKELPMTNAFAPFAYPGFQHGFFYLRDKERHEIFVRAADAGIPPPIESIKRVTKFPNFEVRGSTTIDRVVVENERLKIMTNRGDLTSDFIILATGYAVDGSKQEELKSFYDQVLLWKDVLSDIPEKSGVYPYLGTHFQFQEKVAGVCPGIENIHCFNAGAFLSHGRISGDIDCIDIGVKRLAEGIAIGLFLQDVMENGEPATNGCSGSCQIDLEDPCCEIK